MTAWFLPFRSQVKYHLLWAGFPDNSSTITSQLSHFAHLLKAFSYSWTCSLPVCPQWYTPCNRALWGLRLCSPCLWECSYIVVRIEWES